MNYIWIVLLVIVGFIAHRILFSVAPVIVKFRIWGGKCMHLHHWLYMGIIVIALGITTLILSRQDSRRKEGHKKHKTAILVITIINSFLVGYILAGICGPSWKKFIVQC